MATLNPYLHFNGNAEEAFNFYKSAFGGEFTGIMRNKDIPAEIPSPTTPEEADKILHIQLPIGENTMLMGGDVPQAFGEASSGTRYHVSVSTSSKEETEKLFNSLSDGGKITMPLADTFFSAYFGMVTDKFGVQWMLIHQASM